MATKRPDAVQTSASATPPVMANGRNAAIGLERRFQPLLIIGRQEFRDLLRELFDIRPVRVIEAETLDEDRDNDDRAEKQRIHHETAGMEQVKYIHFSKDPLIQIIMASHLYIKLRLPF